MTDIEFFDNGSVKIKQWWYLMPPHLKAGISEADLFISTPEHIDGVVENNGNLFYNNYENAVSKITENVLKRFASDKPLPVPTAQEKR